MSPHSSLLTPHCISSSGDDGLGNSIVRDDPELGCSQAWPSWPAASPYVTAVGGTQVEKQNKLTTT